MNLAARVKQKRIKLGKTQTELAEASGMTQQSIMTIESGTTKKTRNILQLAKALDCSADWLMYGVGDEDRKGIDARRIPLISYVQAGLWASSKDITSHNGEFEYILTDVDWSSNAFALKIEGDSMEPEFKSGDIIVIDPEVKPAPGEFVVAKNGDDEATFKKYRHLGGSDYGDATFELIPINNDYPTLRSTTMRLAIIGTMVEHRIYRRKR